MEIPPKGTLRSFLVYHSWSEGGEASTYCHREFTPVFNEDTISEEVADVTDEVPIDLAVVYCTSDAEAGRPPLSGADLSHAVLHPGG